MSQKGYVTQHGDRHYYVSNSNQSLCQDGLVARHTNPSKKCKHEDGEGVPGTNCKNNCQTSNVRWQFSNQEWHCEQAAWMNADCQVPGDMQLWLHREGFPPLQRHWYTALCTWYIRGELRCHLLLCHAAAIMGVWETALGAPPCTGTSLFWRSICGVVAKICWRRVPSIPNFCWLYSKTHNKTLKICFKTGFGQVATFNQLLNIISHQKSCFSLMAILKQVRFRDSFVMVIQK